MIEDNLYNKIRNSNIYCNIDTGEVLSLLNQLNKQRQELGNFLYYENMHDNITIKAYDSKQLKDILIKIKKLQKDDTLAEAILINDRINQHDNKEKEEEIIINGFQLLIFEISKYVSSKCFGLEELFDNKNNSQISILSISKKFNTLDQQTLEEIGNQLIQCPNLYSLTLDFECNQLNTDVTIIGQQIPKAVNLISLTLCLEQNRIGQNKAQELCSELSKCNDLQELTIKLDNNQLQTEGAASLGAQLEYFSKLTSLSLSLLSNNIYSAGIVNLAKGVSKCKSLKQLYLNFDGNQIGEQGFLRIFKGIEGCQVLQKLELEFSGCGIGESIAKFSISIEKLTYLNYLKLSIFDNQLQSTGVSHIMEGLSLLTNLNYLSLNLSENTFDEIGLVYIGKGLSQLKNLISLNLNCSNNEFDPHIYPQLFYNICQCTKLKHLMLDLNIISEIYHYDILDNVGNYISQLKDLIYLYLDFSTTEINPKQVEDILKLNRKQLRLVQAKISYYQ